MGRSTVSVSHRRRNSAVRVRELAIVAALAFAALPLASSIGLASDVDDRSGSTEAEPITLQQRRLQLHSYEAKDGPPAVGQSIWTWSAGQRGYALFDDNGDETYEIDPWNGIYGFDLASRTVSGQFRFRPIDGGSPHSVVVDELGGRVIAAYGSPTLSRQVLAGAPAILSETCLTPGLNGSCFGGVWVLDADTLAPLRKIPYAPVGTATGATAARLVAMSVAPRSASDSLGAKVLAVVEESLIMHPGTNPEFMPRSNGLTIHYAVQFDLESGAQDWSLRLDACRGGREPRDSQGFLQSIGLPHPAAIFRPSDPSRRFVYVGCSGQSQQQGLVVRIPVDDGGFPAMLPVTAGDPGAVAGQVAERGQAGVTPTAWVGPAPALELVVGPEKVFGFIADPASERLMMKVADAGAEVWWVFDGHRGGFLGTIGIGPFGHQHSMSGFDPASGRLYVLAPASGGSTGGLFVADTRRTPVPQALVFPRLAEIGRTQSSDYTLGVNRMADGAVEVYARMGGGVRAYHVIIDRLPPTSNPPADSDYAGRTIDLHEVEGTTASTLDGTARGYGARVLLVGGVEGASRVGPVDPGTVHGLREIGGVGAIEDSVGVNEKHPCSQSNREVVFGFVGPEGPSVVDGSGARGSAEPVIIDSSLRADLEAPVSRCSYRNWQELWSTGLFGRPPMDEPQVPWLLTDRLAECVATDDETSDSVGDPVSGRFAARVRCGDQQAEGFSYARVGELNGLTLTEALSSFRIYRDPGRGIVSVVESTARGLHIPGVLSIDSVRGRAESWANGRRQPVPESEREPGYTANCDYERTAGTCFQRHLFGVRTPGYSCGPCGDEQRVAEALSRALGGNGKATLRRPDPRLAEGAQNGFIAAIQKPDHERFADLVLNNDLIQTVVPALELVRYTAPNRQPFGRPPGPRGRQVYQFAGVEVSSSYAITCLLVYDEAANVCDRPTEPPGSITVSLAGPGGAPLAGGAFELRTDADGDGVAGLTDPLTAGGACVTAADGVGTCRFEGLTAGAYLVSQIVAPLGHDRVNEPYRVELAAGEARTAAFTNASNTGVVGVEAVDEAGLPVAGASFALFGDQDGDGKVTAGAEPAPTCVTDTSGACSMRVPTGSYVLVQTATPAGLQPIEPIAFALSQGGQTAAVRVVNTNATTPMAPSAPPAPVYTQASPPRPAETVAVNDPATAPTLDAGSPLPEALGGTIVRVIRSPGDALRLLARQPQQAAAWLASVALLFVATAAVGRRRAVHSLAMLTLSPVAPMPRRGHQKPGAGPATRGDYAAAVLDLVPQGAADALMPMASATTRVGLLIADAALATLVRERLRAARPHESVAQADTLAALGEALASHPVDVLIVDLSMQRHEELLPALKALFPMQRTVGLIRGESGPDGARQGFVAGMGSLLMVEHDLGNGNLAYVVAQVAKGNRCYGPAVQTLLVDCFAANELQRLQPQPPYLTERELEIARLAALGFRREIAARLVISEETVKTHLRRARHKLGLSNPRDYLALRRRLEQLDLME